MSIGKHTQHDVVSGGVMDEGPLGVDEEDVRHPDLFDQAAVEGHALVRGAGERQTLVLPIVSQVQGHGEVLVESLIKEHRCHRESGSWQENLNVSGDKKFWVFFMEINSFKVLAISTSDMVSRLST